jgi:hypothetical protein
MSIEIPKEARNQAIASIERYFLENMDEKIGNVSAGALLGFFIEEIGLSTGANTTRPKRRNDTHRTEAGGGKVSGA